MTVNAASLGPAATAGADLLLSECGRLKDGEAVAIICDAKTATLGRLLRERAQRLGGRALVIEIPPLAMHGQEPPAEAARAMRGSALCLGITAKSMAHTQARLSAARGGTRYLSLPDYSAGLLASAALRADYRACAARARKVADALDGAREIRVHTAAGTDIKMSAAGRRSNCCPGFVARAGELGSPPDVESNVSPLEDSAEGTVVVDGSIPFPGLGLLKEPLRLRVRDGRITGFEGSARLLGKLDALFTAHGPKAYVLAECGVGLNDRARLTGAMLTDEGAMGTMHFGFGSNSTVGGVNDVAFHLDFVFRAPTLRVDGRTVLERGRLEPSFSARPSRRKGPPPVARPRR